MSTTYGYDPNWTTDLGAHAPQHGADSLQGVLASIPGLSSYLAYDQYLNTQNKKRQIDEVLSNNPDTQSAIPSLIRLGPHGIEAAKQLAEGEKLRQDNAMGADIQKMIRGDVPAAPGASTANPALYRALGVKMNLAGKVGGSALASEADRIEKLATEKASLAGMRSIPEVPAVGDQGPNIPAEAKPGIVPDYLFQDQLFSNSAKALQARINAGSFTSPADVNKALENMTSSYNSVQSRKADIAARGEEARKTKQTAPSFDPQGIITPEAKEAAAARYNIDGTLPTNLGRGNQGAANTVSILNRAAEKAKEAGNDPEASRIRQIANKASTTALGALSKDLAAIGPFHDMLNTNAKIAVDLAKKISSDRTGSQFVNKPITWLQANAADNPDIAEYLFQMQVVKTEGARILNNPRLVGQLTDSARHEMGDVINGNMPLGQTERVLKRMMADGDNRVNAITKQRDVLLRGMRSTSGTATPAVSAPINSPAPPAGFTPL